MTARGGSSTGPPDRTQAESQYPERRPVEGEGVTYTIDGDNWSVIEGEYTITATLANAKNKLVAPAGSAWVVADDDH